MPQVGAANLGNPGSIPSHSAQSLHPSSSQHSVAGSRTDEKGPDYVYFERKPSQFGEAVTGKAMAAKMKLELYYKEAVEGVVGRKERYAMPPPSCLSRSVDDLRRTTLEKQIAADALTPDSIKARHLQALGRRESK
jgi:protein-serine/threonine kinase